MKLPNLSISSDDLDVPVVRRSNVVVVGGGPAGVSAAVAAARTGVEVTLLERYSALGGLASGGMVLVLDDMINGDEITVTGHRRRVRRADGEDRTSPSSRRSRSGAASPETVEQVGPLGHLRLPLPQQPQADLLRGRIRPRRLEAGLQRPGPRGRREPAAAPLVLPADRRRRRRIKGVVCETKAGPQAVLGDVVIDTTGDIDVAVPGRRAVSHRTTYLVTLVFRLGGVDTDAAEKFEQENPREARAINRTYQAAAGWRLGAVVAQDADPRRGVVQHART